MSHLRRLVHLAYSPRYILATNTCTGALFWGCAEVICQKCIEKRKWNKLDQHRMTTSTLSGVYMGFVGHYWYAFLDKRFAGKSMPMIRKKLLAELIIGPPFAASIFVVVGMLERKPFASIYQEIKKNVHYLFLFDWCFYIPLQYLNFRLLPPKYRFLFVAFISIVYDTALVYIIRKDQPSC